MMTGPLLRLLTKAARGLLAAAVAAAATACDDATGPSAEAFAIKGLDVSIHNGDVDFNAVREQGYSFAIIKATEGTDWQDRRLTANYARARNAGLKVGLYHFFRFDSPGRLQALNIIEAAATRPSDLPLTIDVERDGNPIGIHASRVIGTLDSCITTLRDYGYRVMIYTNKQGYNRWIKGHFDDVPLWLSSLDEGSPADKEWTLWQYSHRGKVEGIEGNVDLNAFAGDSAAFAAFATGHIIQ